MVRRFAVGSPADLAAMEAFVTDGTCGNVARVWSAMKKQGKAAFDDRILVVFDTERNGVRHATVIRLGLDDEIHQIAELRYNKALHWCAQYLRPAA